MYAVMLISTCYRQSARHASTVIMSVTVFCRVVDAGLRFALPDNLQARVAGHVLRNIVSKKHVAYVHAYAPNQCMHRTVQSSLRSTALRTLVLLIWIVSDIDNIKVAATAP